MLSFHLSFHLSIHLSFHLSFYLFIHLFILHSFSFIPEDIGSAYREALRYGQGWHSRYLFVCIQQWTGWPLGDPGLPLGDAWVTPGWPGSVLCLCFTLCFLPQWIQIMSLNIGVLTNSIGVPRTILRTSHRLSDTTRVKQDGLIWSLLTGVQSHLCWLPAWWAEES